jgi:predicted transcriptional regulator
MYMWLQKKDFVCLFFLRVDRHTVQQFSRVDAANQRDTAFRIKGIFQDHLVHRMCWNLSPIRLDIN